MLSDLTIQKRKGGGVHKETFGRDVYVCYLDCSYGFIDTCIYPNNKLYTLNV